MKRGPAPSKLGPLEPPAPCIRTSEVRAIVHRACTAKQRFGARTAKKVAGEVRARTGRPVTAYGCPFATVVGDPGHWHIGHPPGVNHLERIALALRYLAQHPDAIR